MPGQTVVVSVLADTKPFAKGFADAGSIASGFTRILAGGAVVAGSALAAVTALATKAAQAAGESQVVAAQTDAVLTSTGKSAGRSAQQVADLATKLSRLSGVDDEVVQGAENMLLTFTQIKGDTFDRAASAALDMSVALKQDASSAAMQLGKALNDPVAGITKLTKIGVTFSDQQKQQIQNYARMGQTAAAQQVILDEINREFGGSAAAFGNTWQGAVGKVKTAFGNVQELVGGSLLPMLTGAAVSVAGIFDAISDNPKFSAWLDGLSSRLSVGLKPISDLLAAVASSPDPFGTLINGLTEISPVFAFLRGVLDGLQPVLPVLGDGFSKLGSAIGSGVAKYGPELADAFGQIVQALVPLAPDLLALIPALLPLIPPLLQLAQQILPPLASLLGTVLPPAIQGVTFVLGLLGPALNYVIIYAQGVLTAVGALFDFLSGSAGPQQFLATIQSIPGPFGDMARAAATFGTAVGTNIGTAIAAVRGFVANVRSTGSEVIGFFVGLPGQIGAALSGAPLLLVEAGRNVVRGLTRGIQDAAGDALRVVSGIGSSVANAFRQALGIRSPSRVFAGFGRNIIQGLQEGLTAVSVVPTIRGIADNVTSAFSVQLATPNLTAAAGASGLFVDPGPRVNVSIVQNNPVTRDPLKQLRQDSEMVAAGLWG